MSWASSITSTVLVILPGPVSPRRFFFPAEDGIRALYVTGVQTCALPISMIVTQVENGMRLEPDRVYVIPPNADIVISHDVLTLRPRESSTAKLHLPIDLFFRSLAAERKSKAIGVILSGTASDGTEGFKAIKAEGGITFVQDPSSARGDGMPHSAINAGIADYSLPPPRLA